MLYYVKTGSLNRCLHAASHHEAAMRSLRGSSEDLGVLVIVNDREIDESDESGNRYFLTQSILDDCSMRLVS